MNQITSLLQSGRNVFLTGAAGTGKSYLVKQIIKEGAVLLASTGIAANNIGGMTVHKFFKLGICQTIDELKTYDKNNHKYYKGEKNYLSAVLGPIKVANLFVIDEISMISSDVLDLIFFRIEQAGSTAPILAVGDFYQLPPVKGEFASKSSNWNFETIELTEIKRTDNIEFAKIQGRIRTGTKDKEVIDFIQSLDKEVENSMHIVATNSEANIINSQHLSLIPSESIKVETRYSANSNNDLESFKKELLINEFFEFKIGCRIMSITNGNGFFNGMMGTVISYETEREALIIAKMDNDSIISFPKHTFKKIEYQKVGNGIQEVVIARAVQFPLLVSAAITIHKSQGLTIDRLTIDCDRIFERGQFYVSISRGSNPKNIHIKNFKERHIM